MSNGARSLVFALVLCGVLSIVLTAASTGLHWRVYDGRRLLASSPALPLSDGGNVTLEFRVPAGTRGGRVALHHLRASGATRMEGTVTLAEVTIERRSPSSGTMRGQEP